MAPREISRPRRVKMYFLFGFLYSLCFCCNIFKDKFTIDKFLTLKKLDFFTKKPIMI